MQWIRVLVLGALLGAGQQAHASGFALIEQSVSSMGNAYAGGAAVAEDASTIFFNPAGLTRICGNQAVSGFHGIIPVADYDDKGSILFPGISGGPVVPNPGPGGGAPLNGNDGRDGGEAAIVGHGYFSKQINDCFFVGFGVVSPFGLATDYDNSWKGRYHAIRSSLMTIEMNPVFAYKVNSCWSVGGGLRVMYAHAKFSNNVDYGTAAWLSAGQQGAQSAAIQTGLNNLGFMPSEEDGRAFLKGNAWGFGGNFGVLWEPCCGTRFGANWRSQVKLKIKGRERFNRLPALIEDPSLAGALAPFFTGLQQAAATNTGVKSDVTLPDSYSVSGYHELNSCWAVMGDITWTRWSTLKELRFRFDNENQADAVTTFKWQNTLRYALGTTYSPNSCWKFRGGLAYDQTPIRNKELRTPRLPGEDRFWTTVGFGYDWSSCIHIDFGYAHLFLKDPKINKTGFEESEDIPRGGIKGKFDAYTDIISAQIVMNF